jgi:segregation and condensation protein B
MAPAKKPVSSAKPVTRKRASPDSADLLDAELETLSPQQRWREWMMRVEAVIFASAVLVTRDMLARVVGRDCSVDLLIDDLRAELADRPYDIVPSAGGWRHSTRSGYGPAIRAASAPTRAAAAMLTDHEAAVLLAIGYFQPVTRGELSKIFGKEISRDLIGSLRNDGFIASGPRSPTPGAPYTFVTTRHFLSTFGFDTLRDLPDMEMLEDSGLLSRRNLADAPAQNESAGEDESDEN